MRLLNLSPGTPFLFLSLPLSLFPWAVLDRNIKQLGKNAHAIMIYDHCTQGAESLLMTLAADRRGKEVGDRQRSESIKPHAIHMQIRL